MGSGLYGKCKALLWRKSIRERALLPQFSGRSMLMLADIE
jgi:hypothetical protein